MLFWSNFNGKYVAFTRRVFIWDSKKENNHEEEPLCFPSGDILFVNDRQFLHKIDLLICTLENKPSVKRGLDWTTFKTALNCSLQICWERFTNIKINPGGYRKLTKQFVHRILMFSTILAD